jgi:hypothetical protein
LHTYGSLAALNRAGGYKHGGVIDEPMLGIGLRTGAIRPMGENGPEIVTSEKGLALLAGLLRLLIGETRQSAARTGDAVGQALSTAGRRSAHQAAHAGGW